MNVTLPDGAIVRTAERADLEQLYALVGDRGVPEDSIDLQLVVEGDGLGIEGTGVVERDGRIVSTATLLEESLFVGATELECGQVEMVATLAEYEHRGYVRALMNWCHELSTEVEQTVQVMVGIPYFYRRFGYTYAIPMHPYALLAQLPDADEAIDVRFATDSDIPEMAALQERLQQSFDVYMPHQDETWEWLLAREGTHQLVATRRHEFIGCARTTPFEGDEPMVVAEMATIDPAATAALLAAACGPDGERETTVELRPGVPGLSTLLGSPQRGDWYYARIPDIGALFMALRPELERRLMQSEFASADQTVAISFWESQLEFPIANGRIGPITTGGPRQIIVSQGGSGLPPDALAPMLFDCGAEGLEARFPDCFLGEQTAPMQALFPPQRSDLMTFYLPA